MRVFLAVEISQENKVKLGQIQDQLKKTCDFTGTVSWAVPQNLHITIIFIGEVAKGEYSCLAGAVSGAVEKIQPFTLQFSSVKCFPGPDYPRVVLMRGGKGSSKFRGLQEILSEALLEAGIDHASPKPPHITLARVKSGSFYIPDTFAVEPLVLDLGSISLKKSKLHPDGAVYTTLDEFSLED